MKTQTIETTELLNKSSESKLEDEQSQSLESSDELCLEDLEAVAGGGCGCFSIPFFE